jgi:hypothetical protein
VDTGGNAVRFDDIVVSTEYVGPLAPRLYQKARLTSPATSTSR